MEIVGAPDLRSPDEARAYLRQAAPDPALPRRQQGEHGRRQLPLRREHLAPAGGATELGPKVEVKNMNCFRAVERRLKVRGRAPDARALDAGNRIAQETRGWVDGRGRHALQRSKEQAHDYRYFPEPDLAALRHRPEVARRLRAGIARAAGDPPRPFRRAVRAAPVRGEPAHRPRARADYYEDAARAHGTPKVVANWVLNEVLRELAGDDDGAVAACPVPPEPPGRPPPADRRRHHQRPHRQGRVREECTAPVSPRTPSCAARA